MRRRYVTSPGAVTGVLALASLAALRLAGQNAATPAPKPAPAKAAQPASPASKTAWGDPNLQGTWFVMADVPLERSAANASKEFLTDEEVAASDRQKGLNPGRNARSSDSSADVTGAYNAVFNSILKTGKRTSMIIDPPDGKIPALVSGTPGAGGRGAGRGGGGGRGNAATQNDNPETTAQNPRCLGTPMPFLPLNTAFAQGTVFQIVQSPKTVGIYMEDDHAGGGNRVIYMDGRPHLPASFRTYLGDSRGHWEGNTLVVETTNFSEGFRGSNPETYKMIERISRLDSKTLRREITFIDPKTWTKPWTVQVDMGRAPDDKHMIFDSSCHEGNYGLTSILIGSRREEQAAAAQKK